MTLAPYRKTITAVVTGGLGWGAMVVASDPVAITASEWLMGGVVLATALGVYGTPNAPTGDDLDHLDTEIAIAHVAGRNAALADVGSLAAPPAPKPPAKRAAKKAPARR